MQHFRPTLAFKPLALFHFLVSSPSAPSPLLLLLAVSLHFQLPLPPDSLRVLQWNADGLRARCTELLDFLLSHPVDLICIQKSNFNLSSSFRTPGFSALQSDRTYSQPDILSPHATHANGGVIFFDNQGLSFSELSIFSLRLTPTLIM